MVMFSRKNKTLLSTIPPCVLFYKNKKYINDFRTVPTLIIFVHQTFDKCYEWCRVGADVQVVIREVPGRAVVAVWAAGPAAAVGVQQNVVTKQSAQRVCVLRQTS